MEGVARGPVTCCCHWWSSLRPHPLLCSRRVPGAGGHRTIYIYRRERIRITPVEHTVENRTVQRGCADSTVATVATHPVGEGGKRQRRLACYVHTVATA